MSANGQLVKLRESGKDNYLMKIVLLFQKDIHQTLFLGALFLNHFKNSLP